GWRGGGFRLLPRGSRTGVTGCRSGALRCGSGLLVGFLRLALCCCSAALVDARDDLADGGGVAGRLQLLDEHAGDRRGDLQGGLVGLHLDDGLVLSDGVAFVLEPGPDEDLADRLTCRGYLDVCCHVGLRSSVVGVCTFRPAPDTP